MTKSRKSIDITLDFISSGGDAGEVFEGICPECNAIIRVATNQWWKEICECGRSWNLHIFATGKILNE